MDAVLLVSIALLISMLLKLHKTIKEYLHRAQQISEDMDKLRVDLMELENHMEQTARYIDQCLKN